MNADYPINEADETLALQLVGWIVADSVRAERMLSLTGLDPADFEGLATRSVLDLTRNLNENNGFFPSALFERLSTMDAQLVATIASEPEPPTLELNFCVREIRRARYQRERTALQGEIDRLQTSGAANSPGMDELLGRARDLGRLIEDLVSSEE